jgi:hypothetical protein
LVVVIIIGSALCWWPAIMEPSLDFPWWLLLALIALTIVLATALSDGRWLRFVVASTVGTFTGLCSGFALFPSADAIANSYAPFAIVVATLLSVFVSLVAGLAGRKLSVSNENRRRAVCLALVCCVAFGPVALALTPPLVAHRVARNDRVAAARFESLKNAVERTMAEAGDPGRICDGRALKRHYSGPPFSEEDWRRIAGNAVRQDGYYFMVYCREQGGYTIHASPWAGKGNGTRQFCTDESGKVGCGVEWNRSRHVCITCTK